MSKKAFYHCGPGALREHQVAKHDEAAGTVDLADAAGNVLVTGVPLVAGAPGLGQASFSLAAPAAAPEPVVNPGPVTPPTTPPEEKPPGGGEGENKIDFQVAGFESPVDYFAAGLEGGHSFSAAQLEENLTRDQLLALADKFDLEVAKSATKPEIAAAILGEDEEEEEENEEEEG